MKLFCFYKFVIKLLGPFNITHKNRKKTCHFEGLFFSRNMCEKMLKRSVS